MEQAVVGGHVEQRCGRHEHVLLGFGGRRRGDTGLGGCGGADRSHEGEVEQVVDRAAMRQLGAFREPRRSRRVEDACIVVGIDVGIRQRRRRGARVDHVRPAHSIGREVAVIPHGDHVQRSPLVTMAKVVEDRRDPLDPLAVADQDLRARVGEAIAHLLGGPPRVHPDTRRTDGDDRPVREHPFGIVAHRDRDPVTVLHAEVVDEVSGQRLDDRIGLGVGEAFVLEHHVVLVAVPGGELPDEAHRRRRRVEHTHRDAAHLDLGHRELAARSSQFVPGFGVLLDHGRHDRSGTLGVPIVGRSPSIGVAAIRRRRRRRRSMRNGSS